ncbi:hypothetical protein ABZP36_025721 [Zizania latifolia]
MARKERAPRGYVPILIGQGEERERILVRTEQLKQPHFLALLDLAVQEFGYEQRGILCIPCTTKAFRSIVGAATPAAAGGEPKS